jgi:hypothetical protein
MRASDPALPPWIASDRQRQHMIDWVITQLDAEDHWTQVVEDHLLTQLCSSLSGAVAPKNLQARRWQSERWQWELARIEAERGNLTPLRKRLPEWARKYINEPKLKKGQRRSYPNSAFKHYAQSRFVDEIKRVRALWQQHYGRCNRPRGQVSAEEIVAERHGRSVDEIQAAVKAASYRA